MGREIISHILAVRPVVAADAPQSTTAPQQPSTVGAGSDAPGGECSPADATAAGPPVAKGTKDQPLPLALFSSTAARTRVFNAFASIFAPSWKSMARRVVPPGLAVERGEGMSPRPPFGRVH